MTAYQAAILLVLLLIAGLVWRNPRDYRRPAPRVWRSDAPLVSILVPARNEAANIEPCLEGLLAQDYPRFELLVLDDGSTDDTAARVERLAARDPRLRVVRGRGLPPGWAGKTHACWQLVQEAQGEWLLFLDADTRHSADLLSRAMGAASEGETDLLSTFPRQEIGSVGEAITVPMIFWLVFTLLPIRQVGESPQPTLVAACGQFLLARADAYRTTGGHGAIPASLHDGLHLARLFKRQGRRVRLADLSGSISCRMYQGWPECWQGFSRNAFQALGSLPLLIVLTLLKALLFLAPYVSLAAGIAAGWPTWSWLALGQVALLVTIHLGLHRRFKYPWFAVLLHPVSVGAVLAIEWHSWRRTLTSGHTVWKGRVISPSVEPGHSRPAEPLLQRGDSR